MNKNDLRYQKTEESLKEALLSLLESDNIDDFSVTDICRKARCSRNAFYQHYESKYDLYNAILQSVIEDIRISCMPVVSSLDLASEEKITEWTHQLLNAVYSRKNEIASFMKNSSPFFDILRNSLYEAIWEGNLYFVSEDKITREMRLMSQYNANGIAGFIQYWLCSTDFPLEKASDCLDRVTLDSFRQLRDLMRDGKSEDAKER